MTDENEQSPAEAFDDLRQEVALLRRAMERWLEQRTPPDYSETLGVIANGLTTASKSLDWLTQRPIVKTTAEQMAREMSKAGKEARAADQRTIADAAKALKDKSHELSGWIASARKSDDQAHEVLRFSALAAGAGAIVAISLMMACLKLVPEYGAAWLLGKDRWVAGQSLMASADPAQWTEMQEAFELHRNNRRAIANCQKIVIRTGQDQRCLLSLNAKD
jgi:hypothetical protein